MKKKLYLLLFIIFIFKINLIFSQNANPPISTKSENNIQDNENAIILSENNTITIIGKKDDFIHFNVTKELKVKIKDSIGLKRYSELILPETFDPTYIFHNSAIRNQNNCLSKIKVISINGNIKRSNGKSLELQTKLKLENIRSVSSEDFYENYVQPHYYFSNLEIGDELYLTYNYEVPYVNNFEKLTSFRIFFNGNDYKQEYNLHISADKDLNIDPKYYNKSEPDSIIKTDNTVHFYWRKKNLYGCINEAGSRPYLSLPYMVITLKPFDRLYTPPYSTEQKFYPFYAIAASQRERAFPAIFISAIEGVKTKQYIGIDKFIKEQSKDITNDSLGYQLLFKIHNTIADEFTYDPDTMHFRHEDNIQTERLGDFLNSKTIREISRYNIYAALISKTGLNFFSSYIVDKRFGEITDEFVKPMFDSDYLFAALLNNNTFQLLYPKNSKFGYYINENPFYFENTRTRLVHLLDYNADKKPVNDEFRSILTPGSKVSDNERKSNVKVDIDLDKLQVIFNAKILLRGQYSTLTRSVYQYDIKNTTINPLYNLKISELNPYTKLISKDVIVKEKYFPFKTSVNVQFSGDSLIHKNSKGIYQLSLINWFNHIYYKNLSSGNRQLDFYADFAGNDTYTYMIKFNKNIKLNTHLPKYEITNDFGMLNIELTQPDPSTIIITSYYVTKTEKVEFDKIQLVKDIYNIIQLLNTSVLEFAIAEQ